MFVVDTNVLVYASNADAAAHTVCRRYVEEWCSGSFPWYLTWGIVYEFLRVTTHPNLLPAPYTPDEAWAFVGSLLDSPGASVLMETQRHHAILGEVLAEIPAVTGNAVFDVRTAVLMREHGIRTIYTHDMDFHRFPFVEVVDPLRGT